MTLLESLAVAAQSSWVAEPGVQRRLAAGEVVVQIAAAADPAHPHGRVQAAVWIRAPAETIWSVITDCAQTPAFVPGLKSCRRVNHAPDGRWEDIEHVVKYSWLFPAVQYVFRAEYDRPRRIDFRRVSGDLKEEEGTWLLLPAPDPSATLVEYEMYLEPGFWVPQVLVNRALRKDLPAALRGLRDRVQDPQTPPPR